MRIENLFSHGSQYTKMELFLPHLPMRNTYDILVKTLQKGSPVLQSVPILQNYLKHEDYQILLHVILKVSCTEKHKPSIVFTLNVKKNAN